MSERTYSHILIIEDNPGIATSLRSGLEREGYQVTCKDKGKDDITFIQSQAPDLIIPDMRLPHGTDHVFSSRLYLNAPSLNLSFLKVHAAPPV